MELWFSDQHTPNVKLSIRVEKQLYSGKSNFQRIDVFDSKEYGKILSLDGSLSLTEKDEFIYHEMITHVPMAVHSSAKNILVIGSGDGGVIRELIKYSTIQSIDMVEIDPLLTEVCQKYLPFTTCGLHDSRVNIHHEHALRFIRNKEDFYDLIIVDSTNLFGPGEALFTKEFYGNCYKALKEDGVLVNQHESPFYTEESFSCQRMHKRIVESFPISRVYQAHIPSYPSGHWMFGFASKRYHPIHDMDDVAWNLLGIPTRYYATRLHRGAFALPVYVEELLRDVE